MAVKYISNTAVFKTGSAGAEPGTTIAQFESGEINLGTINMVDTTGLSDATKTMAPGTKEPIRITGTLRFDPGDNDHDSIVDAMLAKTLISAGIYYPNNATTEVYSDGYITEFSTPFAVDGALNASFTFQGTGAPTYTQTPV